MQAVERGRGADAVSVQLGAPAGGLQAQLDGFKSRAVRASALMQQQQQQHAYVTDWRAIEQGASGTTAPAMVILSSEALGEADRRPSYGERAEEAAVSTPVAVAFAAAMQHGQAAALALCALEAALLLVQTTQASQAPAPVAWLLTAGAQQRLGSGGEQHAGAWGLARTVRAETQLQLRCLDSAVITPRAVAHTEPEAVWGGTDCMAPRLAHAPRLASVEGAELASGTHLITGGTRGLGLLTGRWLAQRGASALLISSRGGALESAMAADWQQLQASGASTLVERCDTAQAAHVFLAPASPLLSLSSPKGFAPVRRPVLPVAMGLAPWPLPPTLSPRTYGGAASMPATCGARAVSIAMK